MKQHIYVIFSIFLILILGTTSCKEDSISPISDNLQSTLQKINDQSNLPGFSVSVIKDGQINLSQSYGFADLENSVHFSSKTLQPIASVSKAILGVAIAKAIEQNLFTLETPINNILNFDVTNPNHPSIPIRVKHLVTHTSSLVDDPELFFATYSILDGENTSSDVAQIMLNEFGVKQGETLELNYILEAYFSSNGDFYDESHFGTDQPGKIYSYSNFASSLAALLIEIKSGSSFKEYVDNYIFTPLGMNNSSYSYELINSNETFAKLYFEKDKPYPAYTSASYPSGSIVSSSEELSYFLIEMIKGLNGNGTILNRASYEILFKELSHIGNNPRHSILWFLEGPLIQHAGNDLGTVAKIEFNSQTNNGYVFISNSEIQFSNEANKNLEDVNEILYALIDEIN